MTALGQAAAGAKGASRPRGFQRRNRIAAPGAAALLALAAVMLGLSCGAVAIPLRRIVEILFSAPASAGSLDAMLLTQIRLPRVALGLEIGAALGASGALMQALFRNPLAEPGLLGVSAGAALAAASTIVIGDRLFAAHPGPLLLPVSACLGGILSTGIVYAVAQRRGAAPAATLLLAGVAFSACAGALTGLLTYIADDRQLRDLTFWSLGSLGGASWTSVGALAVPLIAIALAAPRLARGLNALSLGEAEAFHLGERVELLKALCVVLISLAVGLSVAAAGAIGFVGILAPQLVRLAGGADHRILLPTAMLLGGAIVVLSDVGARTLAAPAELPIGILTAALGGPFFLVVLRLRRLGGVGS